MVWRVRRKSAVSESGVFENGPYGNPNPSGPTRGYADKMTVKGVLDGVSNWGWQNVTEYPEGWEEWVAFLTAHLPEPTQQEVALSGVTFFTAGDPPEVVVRLSHSSITVLGFACERGESIWRRRRLGIIMWRQLASGTAMTLVGGLIASAHDMRLATYRQCDRCEKMKPPEQMHDGEDVCLECARISG